MSFPDTAISRSEKILRAMPSAGLFSEKSWRISPDPFPLDKKLVNTLRQLGSVLHRFQQASDSIYRRSRKGGLPEWIASYLDRGKPEELLQWGLASPVVTSLPRVIRPDLILTEDGFTATELDSVPGGIGLTAWLGRTYAEINPQTEIVGGADGMLKGFRSIFGEQPIDIAVSQESGDYRPEMEWLAGHIDPQWEVKDAESYVPRGREVYRFFELFDLPQVPGGRAIAAAAASGELDLTSPTKPWLEEKAWLALFRSLPLRELWRRELREANWKRLQAIFPESWIVDPAEVPHHAGIPGLDIQNFSELGQLSQNERRLVLKISGFNETAWGSRSVTIGQDVSQEEWKSAVSHALGSFDTAPYVLQRFHSGKLVKHAWYDDESGQMRWMEGRVRLCPYYFVNKQNGAVDLGGVLATIVPADKKIIHGMRDAILVPCSLNS